ncbi:MAG: translocation/assembly module TamB domain-containing protein [Flavobacteriales bacterium]
MTKVLKITGLCISLLFELLLLLVFVFVFAIRNSQVQSYLAEKATSYLSTELKTKISIEKVDIVLFKHVDLKNVFIQDLQGNTLVNLAHLLVDLDKIKLINKQLLIKKINIDTGTINLNRSAQNGTYNFQFLIDYFGSDQPVKENSNPLEIQLEQLVIQRINFSYHDLRKDTLAYGVDYDHIALENLHLVANQIQSAGEHQALWLRSLGFKERSGFDLKHLAAKVDISNNGVVLKYVNLRTKNSKVYFPLLALRTTQLSDFEHFDDRVRFDVSLQTSQLHLKDLSYFVPDLKGMDQRVFVAGRVKNELKRLSIQQFKLLFGQKSIVRANLLLPDFRLATEQLRFKEQIKFAYLDFQDLENLRLPEGVAALQIPVEIEDLAYLEVKNANLKGGLNDFQISIQKAQTELGNFALAPLRVKQETTALNLAGVQSDSTLLTLQNFNLGPLAAYADLGACSGNLHFNLDVYPDGSYALNELKGQLKKLQFQNYGYQNIILNDVSILKNQLKAEVQIQDPHLNAQTSLSLSVAGALNEQFDIDVTRADLTQLGYGTRENNEVSFHLRGGIQGPSWSDISGYASITNLVYLEEQQRLFTELAQVHFSQSANNTFLQFSSPIFDLNVAGLIDFDHIAADLLHHLAIVYPSLEPSTSALVQSTSDFTFDLQIRNAKQMLDIFANELELANNTRIYGSFDSPNEKLQLNVSSSSIRYQDFRFEQIKLNQVITKDQTTGDLAIALVSYADSTNFHDLKFINSGAKGVIDAAISWDPNTNDFSELKWRTTILPDDYLNFNLQPSFFTINGIQWEIANQSDILLSAAELNVSNFELHRGYQLVKINGCLSANLRDQMRFDVIGLDLAELSNLLDFPNQLSGRFSGWGALSTPNNSLSILADANLEQFEIDDQMVGDIMLHSDWNDARKSILLEGTLQYRNERTFDFDGLYNIKTDELDLGLNFKQTDISFANAFMDPEVVKGIKGKLNGRIRVLGSPADPKLSGKLRLQNGAAEVALLGVQYQLEGQIQVTEDAFFLDNFPIKDPEGNIAYLSSAINHQQFGKWNYDIQINFEDDIKKIDPRTNQVAPIDRFLLLNTKYKEGDVYYGKAYGRGTANIFGTANNTDITVDATTRKGTDVIFPMYGMSEIDDEDNFVKFVTHGVQQKFEDEGLDFTGLNLDLNFHITPDANMKLIFNEQTGDEITAKGAGDLNIKLDQFDQLTMNGPYVIAGGSRYNFALGSIKQTFDIEAGSKIEWTGDPYNADITINTVTPKRASILELSPEIQDNTLVNQEILCYLKLSETLLSPKISFDLVAPRVSETGKTLLDRVKADPDELNRQFFSLLLVSKFQPLKGNLSAGGSAALDLLESQINAALGKLSDNYKLNVDYGSDAVAGESKVELGVAKGFLDDKLVITGSFGVENKSASADGSKLNSNTMIGDVNIEYKVQDNFRVRAFNQSNTNSVNENQGPFTQGVGVSYYEEFNHFAELAFVKQVKQMFVKSPKKSGQPRPKKHRQPVTLPSNEKSTSSQSRRDRSTRA